LADINIATALAAWDMPVKYCTALPANALTAVKNYYIYLYGLPFAPKNVVRDGVTMLFKFLKNQVAIAISGDFGKIVIE
jgi:hypothetical protein